jgi:hypothetical protein
MACAAVALAGGSVGARAQTGQAPLGAVGMDNGPAKSNPDPIVAEVEGQAIHLSDVGDAIRAMPGVAPEIRWRHFILWR